MKIKLSSLLLAAVMLASVLALCVSAEGVCLHDTVKGVVKTDSGITITNVCKNCGEAVSDIGYVDASQKITLYKENTRATAYSEAELKAGFASADGKALYTPAGVLTSAGKPYWLSFDLKINSLPTLESGDLNGDSNARIYKGCSVICAVTGGNYFSQLRLIYDGWETESGAEGTKRGTLDGISPIKPCADNNGFRDAETIVEAKVGETLHFDMRIDPSTGAYDVYVDGLYEASGVTGKTSSDSNAHIRLWEADGKKHGGNFDFSNIEVFYDDYTKAVHTHSFTEYTEFYDKGLYRYEACACGVRNELECEEITSVVKDGLAHIYNGLGEFAVNSSSYWFVTDVNIRGEIGDGSLLKFGDQIILEAKDGKLVSGAYVLGTITYPTTYQIAVEIENGSYDLYVNGRYALSGTVANANDITCGDKGFDHHVRFMYNKAVTLGETATPAIPTYTADKTVKLCYHSDDGMSARHKMLAHTKDGVEYIYNCSECGERVYSMLKKDLTNPANDTAYRHKAFAIMREEMSSLTTEKPRYLYLENNVIGKTASPYWLTFDVTPKSLPSNETGDLNDPNTRAYKGYGLVSTEASFMPATEIRVIPDGWETGNASGTTKGVTDGRCEVHIIAPLEGFDATTEAKVDSFHYRRSETVAYLEVGKTTSFALRIAPKTGNYDVYVDGVYKASSDKPAMPDMNPKIIFHDNGLGEFTYSNISVCEESQSFDDKVVAIEFNAKFEADEGASANAYTSLIAIERKGAKYNLFYANNKNGTLEFKDESGNFNTLYDVDGNIVYLNANPKLAVVYDDIGGDVRYFVNGKLAQFVKDEKLVYANGIKAYDSDFVNAEGGEDSLRFDIAKVTNLNVIGLGATDTAEVVGFQPNELDDSIRLVSGIDSLYYGAVGYEVQAYMKDGTPYKDMSTSKTSDTIYSSVKADGVMINASKYGYNYFSALKIAGDFLGYKDSYIIVKPFTVIGGEKYYGEGVKLNILDNGRYEFAESN